MMTLGTKTVFAVLLAMLTTPAAVNAAGDVIALVKGGKLLLIGDAEANSLTLDQVGLTITEVRITPIDTTTVNGVAAPTVLTGVIKGLVATLGEGSNDLDATASAIVGDVVVKAGSLDDTVVLGGNNAHKVKILLGAGANRFSLANDSVVLKLDVKTGDGADTVSIDNGATAGGNVTLTLGAGDNNIFLDPTSRFNGNVVVKTKDGADDFFLNNDASLAKNLTLDLGTGMNNVFFNNGTSVAGSVVVKGPTATTSSS